MRTRFLLILALGALVASLIPLPASAQSETLTVGLFNTPPLAFIEKDGRPAGLYIDVLNAIAQQEGWTLNYVQCQYAVCLQELAAGRIDLLPALAYSSAYPQSLAFNRVNVVTNWIQLFTAPDRHIENIADLNWGTLVTLSDSPFAGKIEQAQSEMGLVFRTVTVSEPQDVIEYVLNGAAHGGVIDRLSIQYHERLSGLQSGSMFILEPIEMRLAAPDEDSRPLLNTIDNYLHVFKADPSSVYNRSYNRWVLGHTIVFPSWLPGVLILAAGMIAVISAGNFMLQRQIRARTAQLEQRTRELQSLLETSRDLNQIRNLDQLLRRITEHAVTLLDADEAIMFRMIDDHYLQPILMLGAHTEELLSATIPVGKGLTGYAVQQQEPLLANNAQLDPRALPAPGTPISDVEHVMVAPLTYRERSIGALLVNRQNKVPFTEDNLKVLVGLAQQCSNAIENARLYQELAQHNDRLEYIVADRTLALQRANEYLERLSRLKDEFVANVSHELRTPIANLKLRRYLLARKPEDLATHLEVIEREINRLEQLVEDLLELSRIDQGRIEMRQTEVDLTQVVTNLCEDRQLLAQERELQLTAELAESLPPVRADARLIEQTLSILVTNALNYTPPGGKVTIRTGTHHEHDRDWASFSVQDTGPGISPDEQERLFERFYRGSAARETGKPGTGLGLSIAHEIVRRHQGHIVVESSGIPGEGATFTVVLPAAVLEPA
ncbi:MAG: hypothetical protein Kow0077_21930 [Anaerolineae bacterium]